MHMLLLLAHGVKAFMLELENSGHELELGNISHDGQQGWAEVVRVCLYFKALLQGK